MEPAGSGERRMLRPVPQRSKIAAQLDLGSCRCNSSPQVISKKLLYQQRVAILARRLEEIESGMERVCGENGQDLEGQSGQKRLKTALQSLRGAPGDANVCHLSALWG